MTDYEAFELMGISHLHGRAFHSNSHGELFHMMDYVEIAQRAQDTGKELAKESTIAEVTDEQHVSLHLMVVGQLIVFVVEFADKHWDRPDTVFQHMPRMMRELLAKT